MRQLASQFGTKGYIGFGNRGFLWPYTYCEDFWEWDQATDTWTQKASNSNFAIGGAVAFSIGSKGYVTIGGIIWEWDQVSNTWTQKATFYGHNRIWGIGFSIGSLGYVGTGDTAGAYKGQTKSFWQYNPSTDTWTRLEDFGGTRRGHAIGFSIGNKGYIGTGRDPDSVRSDFWEFSPAFNDILPHDFIDESIRIFPNPASGKISIESPIKSFISIFNINGKLIETYNPSNNFFTIDLSNIQAGLYFLKIRSDNQIVIKKVIIQ